MAVAPGENKTACYQDTRTLCDQFTSLRSCKSSINAAGFLTALCAGADPLGTTGWGCSSNCARVLVQCAPTIMQGNNDGESNTCAPSRPLGLVYAFGPARSVRRGCSGGVRQPIDLIWRLQVPRSRPCNGGAGGQRLWARCLRLSDNGCKRKSTSRQTKGDSRRRTPS